MKKLDIEKMTALIRTHTEAELKENTVGGKEIIVHQNGARVYHRRFGCVSAGGPPLPERTIFRAASMTKPITAAAVLQLADRGALALDAPAARYYPQLRNMKVAKIADGKIEKLVPAQNEIRVCDLLSHTSGVGCAPVDAICQASHRVPLNSAIEEILQNPLAFEPRTAQSYSATEAFDLAAGIVQMVSGMEYDAYLKNYIFDPLGMTDTAFGLNDAQWARMVSLHKRTPDGQSADAKTEKPFVFADFLPERMAAGAGLATTAEDYIRFAEMLCRGGTAEDGTIILSKAAVRRMSASNVPDCVHMGCEHWGLGVRVITGPGYSHGLGVGCFGWSGAYGTHFWVDPENHLSVVMMKNSMYDGGAGNCSACTLEEDVCAALE